MPGAALTPGTPDRLDLSSPGWLCRAVPTEASDNLSVLCGSWWTVSLNYDTPEEGSKHSSCKPTGFFSSLLRTEQGPSSAGNNGHASCYHCHRQFNQVQGSLSESQLVMIRKRLLDGGI